MVILGSITNEEKCRSNILNDELVDVAQTIESSFYHREYAILKYLYCPDNDCLIYVIVKEGKISIGKVFNPSKKVIDSSYLLTLHSEYVKNFIKTDNDLPLIMHHSTFKTIKNTWEILYGQFILPVLEILKIEGNLEILTTVKMTINDEVLFFNIPLLHNLSYRFLDSVKVFGAYFVTINYTSTFNFITTLNCLNPPTFYTSCLLNGFINLDKKKSEQLSLSANDRKSALVREEIFTKSFKLFEAYGGTYYLLKEKKDLEYCLTTENERNTLFLFAHFHNGRLHMVDINEYVKLSEILSFIDKKKQIKQFNNTLILDAVTCSNYTDFAALKTAGINYINFTHNDISTDLAAYTFYELVSGTNAQKLGLDFPYLNGTDHLHIVYSKILRGFFIQMKNGNNIKFNIMDQNVTLTGTQLENILSFLEEEKETNSGNNTFSFISIFDDGNASKGNVDLVNILLSGFISGIGQILALYLMRDVNNEIELTFNIDGIESKIKLKNKSEKEIAIILKDPKLYLDSL